VFCTRACAAGDRRHDGRRRAPARFAAARGGCRSGAGRSNGRAA